ncbi:MAG: glycosyltransferase family 1 protein [Chromatiaceae bacterium]|nr:MAG: glycosyltransferase family 1 protein [Chromatiaceae bacterium]
MRILHIEGGAHLYGGAQQVLYLLEGLAAAGVENLLACRAGCALATQAAPWAEVHGLPMGGDLDLLLLPRLLQLMRRTRPQLVHLHSRIGADVLGALAARRAGLPVVHTRRVDNPEPRLLAALKYRLHDRVIAISEGIGAVLLAAGVPPAKLRIVRSAVPAATFAGHGDRHRTTARLGLPPNALLLGVVAQLIPRKGHAVLLDAAPALLAAEPRLHLVCFGQGPLAAPLAARIAADQRLTGRVHLAGFRQDLPDLLGGLDLLVHPALMEGLGVALLQAAAAGVPIVASRVGGIPEAVADGETGLLVPPGDATALAAAIQRLLADANLRRRFGQAGSRRVRDLFAPAIMVAGNLAVYRELLDPDAAPAGAGSRSA